MHAHSLTRGPLHLQRGDIAGFAAELHADQVDGAARLPVLAGVPAGLDLRQRLSTRPRPRRVGRSLNSNMQTPSSPRTTKSARPPAELSSAATSKPFAAKYE